MKRQTTSSDTNSQKQTGTPISYSMPTSGRFQKGQQITQQPQQKPVFKLKLISNNNYNNSKKTNGNQVPGSYSARNLETSLGQPIQQLSSQYQVQTDVQHPQSKGSLTHTPNQSTSHPIGPSPHPQQPSQLQKSASHSAALPAAMSAPPHHLDPQTATSQPTNPSSTASRSRNRNTALGGAGDRAPEKDLVVQTNVGGAAAAGGGGAGGGQVNYFNLEHGHRQPVQSRTIFNIEQLNGNQLQEQRRFLVGMASSSGAGGNLRPAHVPATANGASQHGTVDSNQISIHSGRNSNIQSQKISRNQVRQTNHQMQQKSHFNQNFQSQKVSLNRQSGGGGGSTTGNVRGNSQTGFRKIIVSGRKTKVMATGVNLAIENNEMGDRDIGMQHENVIRSKSTQRNPSLINGNSAVGNQLINGIPVKLSGSVTQTHKHQNAFSQKQTQQHPFQNVNQNQKFGVQGPVNGGPQPIQGQYLMVRPGNNQQNMKMNAQSTTGQRVGHNQWNKNGEQGQHLPQQQSIIGQKNHAPQQQPFYNQIRIKPTRSHKNVKLYGGAVSFQNVNSQVTPTSSGQKLTSQVGTAITKINGGMVKGRHRSVNRLSQRSDYLTNIQQQAHPLQNLQTQGNFVFDQNQGGDSGTVSQTVTASAQKQVSVTNFGNNQFNAVSFEQDVKSKNVSSNDVILFSTNKLIDNKQGQQSNVSQNLHFGIQGNLVGQNQIQNNVGVDSNSECGKALNQDIKQLMINNPQEQTQAQTKNQSDVQQQQLALYTLGHDNNGNQQAISPQMLHQQAISITDAAHYQVTTQTNIAKNKRAGQLIDTGMQVGGQQQQFDNQPAYMIATSAQVGNDSQPSNSLSRAGSTGRFRNPGATKSANASATKQMFQTYSGASGYKVMKKRPNAVAGPAQGIQLISNGLN